MLMGYHSVTAAGQPLNYMDSGRGSSDLIERLKLAQRVQ